MRATVVGGALLALLVAGCAASGAPEEASRTTSTEITASEASSIAIGVSPTPSPDASAEAPPEIDLTAEDGDYRHVVEEILRFREWLFAHPHRQDLISVIYNDDCPCVDALTRRLAEFTDNASHALVDFQVVDYDFVADDTRSARLVVIFEGTGRIVSSSGETLDQGTSPSVTEEWLLLRDSSGRFRVADQIEITQ